MIFLIAVLSFFVIFGVSVGIINATAARDTRVKQRMQSMKQENAARGFYLTSEEELEKSLTERLFGPFIDDITRFMKKIAPGNVFRSAVDKSERVGRFVSSGINTFVIIWFVSVIACPLVTAYYTLVLRNMNYLSAAVAIIVAILAGITLPLIWLNALMEERKQKMLEHFPDMLDLLCVSVQAGLGFNGALQKVVDKMDNPLSDEFKHMLRELRMGIPRRQAMDRFAKRCDLTEISTFVSAIAQSDRMGVSISHVLNIQADNVRDMRKNSIKEKAAKLPVKILIPMVLFILPPIFLVILGPKLLTLSKIFIK